MKIGKRIVQFSILHPKAITALIIATTLIFGALASTAVVDTDPENMLAENEAVRVFHNRVKQEFTLYDMVVLGVVNEKHPDGVFNPTTLNHVQEVTEYLMSLSDPNDPNKRIISRDVIAPGNVDNIKQAGPGQVRFEWLMNKAPETRDRALQIRDDAMSNPLFNGTMVSEDGKSIGIFAPISTKNFADQVRTALLKKIETLDSANGDKYYITGLPVAEDSFGKAVLHEMFTSPPLAMLVIFLLMLLFFKKIKLVISPMLVAMFSVVCTMGLLNISGSTFHIMSSMIPTFLMPIAIVDSIHILSEFFDVHQKIKDRHKTLEHVMNELFTPMLYTSLTSAAGFASLALAPIPPIQVFGIFVAIGIMLAWLFTVTFIPAVIMLLKEKTVENIGVIARKVKGSQSGEQKENKTMVAGILRWMGGIAFRRAKLIIAVSILLIGISGYGVTKLQQNDNPMNWFIAEHPIRVADRVLNSHFGGTYELFLVLESNQEKLNMESGIGLIKKELATDLQASKEPAVEKEILSLADQLALENIDNDFDKHLDGLIALVEQKQESSTDASYEAWSNALLSLEKIKTRDQIFKQPEMLRYVEKLQTHMLNSNGVGKSNSITDIIKKVHQELFEGDARYQKIPESKSGVAQCLISYQNSHRPEDLWHFVTPDYSKANIWIQLRDGDNKTTVDVVKSVDQFIANNPPPGHFNHQWAGLSYINVTWQNKMVTGMGNALMSSFAVVLVMMIFLFRSVKWGLLAMVPLSATIATIYGFIGWIGKDYDMPIAVLSSLALGLAVDFAIHFIQRVRETYDKKQSWAKCATAMFEEPARAITRNAIVIAVGFAPLLLSTLNPYRTVGLLFAGIMSLSGICTLLILPSILTVFEKAFFKLTEEVDFEDLQAQEE